jgi:Mn2+/Fe2+ NRAMP family transporter
MGYLEWHVLLRHYGLFHHSGDRSDAQRGGSKRHRDGGPGGERVAAACRRICVMLFALGILGVGLIGVPVLAGSAAYALSEAMGWKFGLERKATGARGFYGVIAVSMLIGLVIQYSPISPMKALFWSAVINGIVAVPLMAVIILLASKKSVMGAFTAGRSIVILGWIATAIMGVAAVCMFIPG